MKKIFAILMAVVVMAVAFTGCAGAATGTGNVAINGNAAGNGNAQ